MHGNATGNSPGNGGTKFHPAQRSRGGRAYTVAQARENEVQRLTEVERILADFGRKPTRLEHLLIDELAGLAVKARRFRSQGRSVEPIVNLMARLSRLIGLQYGGSASPDEYKIVFLPGDENI
jgi:hypothetical protein